MKLRFGEGARRDGRGYNIGVPTCPRCEEELEGVRLERGAAWRCPSCNGQAVMLPVLRRYVPADFARHLWSVARNPASAEGQPCPSCRRPAREAPATPPIVLDVCPRCQLVWFDPMELDTLPRLPRPEAEVRTPAAAEALARFELEHQRRVRGLREGSTFGRATPDALWKVLPGLLGFPVEMEEGTGRERPWATWGLLALIAVVALATFGHIDRAVMAWGLVADAPLRHGGLTFLTSFFLHAGWMHLLGNLYFLWVFGDDVEGLVGWKRMLVLVFASAFLGDLLHVLLVGGSVPAVGSSGGISGVLAFYGIALPRARIGLLFWYVLWIRVPAWGYLVFWVFLQALGATVGGDDVAYLAHLGGALGGVGLWFLWRDDLLESLPTAAAAGRGAA